MVARIARLLRREVSGLHAAAYILGGFALLSSVLALVRDRVLAHLFGAGSALDAYYAAFKIPNLIFVGVASLFSLYAIIPLLNNFKLEGEEVRRFLGGLMASFGVLSIVVSVGGFFLLPFIAKILFPTILNGSYGTSFVLLGQILLLQPILLGLSGIFASVTQTYGRFALYALGPVLYNVGIVIGATFFYPVLGLIGLGWGVVLGASLHMGVQIPFLLKEGFLQVRHLRPALTQFLSVSKLSLPRTIALSSHHGLLFVFIALAALLSPGSVAVFSFAFNLQAVPLAIIGMSYSVAAFPTLARLYAKGDLASLFQNLSTAIRHILFWSLPIIFLGIVLRAHIVRVILGSGAFDWADTRLTAAAFALFLISLAAQGMVLLLSRASYAMGLTKPPLIASAVGIIVASCTVLTGLLILNRYPGLVLDIAFFLRAEGLSGAVLVLPAAYSVGVFAQVCTLFFLLPKNPQRSSEGVSRLLAQSLFAGVLAGLTAYLTLQIVDPFIPLTTFSGVFLQGIIAGCTGLFLYVLTLVSIGNREIYAVWRTVRQRLRAEAVAAEDIDL